MSKPSDAVEFMRQVGGGSEMPSTATEYVVSADQAIPCAADVDKCADHIDAAEKKVWAVYNENSFTACQSAVSTLEPGQYSVRHSDTIGVYLYKEDIILDNLIELPDSDGEKVLSEIERFWSLEEKFRTLKMLWKRGVMLYGPPGSGKTSIVQILSNKIIERGGISVYVGNVELTIKGLQMIRQIEKERPIVAMLEDIDAILGRSSESTVLSLLDGELQIDNITFIATTNYPEKLDKRLLNRPSRFDLVMKIGMPSAEARRAYLKEKNQRLAKPENEHELDAWVGETKEFSIAHLKELIILVEVFDLSRKEAVARLRSMFTPISSTDFNSKLGF